MAQSRPSVPNPTPNSDITITHARYGRDPVSVHHKGSTIPRLEELPAVSDDLSLVGGACIHRLSPTAVSITSSENVVLAAGLPPIQCSLLH